LSRGSRSGLRALGDKGGGATLFRMDRRAEHEKMAYTVEEAGRLLSLSRAQMYRLIDLKEIATISVGRSRRITARQIDAFVRAKEQAGGFTDRA
jgi:excisionase family DNA binding protein